MITYLKKISVLLSILTGLTTCIWLFREPVRGTPMMSAIVLLMMGGLYLTGFATQKRIFVTLIGALPIILYGTFLDPIIPYYSALFHGISWIVYAVLMGIFVEYILRTASLPTDVASVLFCLIIPFAMGMFVGTALLGLGLPPAIAASYGMVAGALLTQRMFGSNQTQSNKKHKKTEK